jgi:hypothetical protein
MKVTTLLSDRKILALALLAMVCFAGSGARVASAQQKAPQQKAPQKKQGAAGKPSDGNMSSAGAGVSEADSGNEDAGDEEMLTGEAPSGQPRRNAPGAKADQGPPPELSFVTRLDRTAVYPGDQFHYQIIVDHSPKIQFVLENVNKDTINMDPLRVYEATSKSFTLKNGNVRLFVDLTLANYAIGIAQLQIPQLTLFYFRREGAGAAASGQEGAAAESLTVPGPVIGVRSTLPPDPSDLRDAVTVSGWASSRWTVAWVGYVALFVLVVGAGWEGFHLIRYRRGRKGPDPRKAMAAIKTRWSDYVPGDFSDANTVLDFYGRSYADVKEYIGYMLETPTAGLTAEDMREEMTRLAANSDLAERTAKVLGICEKARYSSNGTDLTGDAARGVAHDVREIFDAGARMI